MPEEKKEKTDSSTEKDTKFSLEKLMLDTKMNRYQLILLTLRWAKELEKHSPARSADPNELINQALQDILSGKVKLEEIIKLSESKKK